MNELSITKTFDFDVEPIFNIYCEVANVFHLPFQEAILNHYDTVVTSKLKDLQYELGDPNGETWTIDNLNDDVRCQVEAIIGMRTRLEIREMTEVFNTFHIMYVDIFDEFRNMPIKDVW